MSAEFPYDAAIRPGAFLSQLELFGQGPFSVRLSFVDALGLFWEAYFQHLPSANACRPHRKRLSEYFRDFRLDSVGKAEVQGFRRWMRAKGYSEATTNKGHMIITRLYNWFSEGKENAVRIGDLDLSIVTLPAKNPGSQVPKVDEKQFARKVVASKERVYLLAGYARQMGDFDLAEIIEGLYMSRLRQSDFYTLTEKNVDTDHGLLQGVQKKTITQKNPSGVPFLVVMPPALQEIVKRRLVNGKPGGVLFPKSNLQKRFTAIKRAAGLGYVTLQDLRRSAATHQLDHGIDPLTVSKGLGHTTQRMLPTYTPRTLKHQRDASEILVKV